MVAIIAFLLSIGVISSPDEATPEVVEQYETQIVNAELEGM